MTHIRQRRASAATWTASNPVLEAGELGWETNTRKAKLGDGVTAWNDLDYAVTPAGAVTSVAGKTGDVTLNRNDVGLGNVNNTADANKPVSTAQQEALDLKADLDSPVLTGNPKAPTPALDDDDDSIATTEFVQDAIDAAISSALTIDDGTIVIGTIRITWGRVTAVDMGGNPTKDVTVVFPTPFADTPTTVTMSVQTATANKIVANISTGAGALTDSGFKATLKTTDGSNSSASPTLHWLAFGTA